MSESTLFAQPNPNSNPDPRPCPWTIRRLNASTYLIRETDRFHEFPHIYAKIIFDDRDKQTARQPALIVLSDTGCGTGVMSSLEELASAAVAGSTDRTKMGYTAERLSTRTGDGYNLDSFLRAMINPGGRLPYLVITTHCHYDHILGLGGLPSTDSGMTTVLASRFEKSFVVPRSHLVVNSLCKAMGVKAPRYEVGVWASDMMDVKYRSRATGRSSFFDIVRQRCLEPPFSPLDRDEDLVPVSPRPGSGSVDHCTTIAEFNVEAEYPDVNLPERMGRVKEEFFASAFVSLRGSSTRADQSADPNSELDNAWAYLDEVKACFIDRSHVHFHFLEIMTDYSKGVIDRPRVLDLTSNLFRDHPDLLFSLNDFVPAEHSIPDDVGIETGLVILQTPGHTPDSLTWYDREERLICVGDSLYERESPDTKKKGEPPMPVLFDASGNMQDWRNSLRKVLKFVREQNAKNDKEEMTAQNEEYVGRELIEESDGEHADGWMVITLAKPHDTLPHVAGNSLAVPTLSYAGGLSSFSSNSTQHSRKLPFGKEKKKRVRLCAAHVTADVDAEDCLVEMYDFMSQILREEVPERSVGHVRGEEHCIWEETGAKGRFSVQGPLRIIEEGRNSERRSFEEGTVAPHQFAKENGWDMVEGANEIGA